METGTFWPNCNSWELHSISKKNQHFFFVFLVAHVYNTSIQVPPPPAIVQVTHTITTADHASLNVIGPVVSINCAKFIHFVTKFYRGVLNFGFGTDTSQPYLSGRKDKVKEPSQFLPFLPNFSLAAFSLFFLIFPLFLANLLHSAPCSHTGCPTACH